MVISGLGISDSYENLSNMRARQILEAIMPDVPTESLPPEVQKEAELTIPDDWDINFPGPVMWRLQDVQVEELLADDDRVYDEDFQERAEKLAAQIKASGRLVPVVVGPGGVEGNHRARAAEILGMQTVPAWVWVPGEE
jgi:ParB/Sulfiredoxin domain